MKDSMSIALEGIRVLDLTQGIAGPYCSMQLGDLGADVIKVEPPGGDWSRQMGPPFLGEESALFWGLNRNKRSIVLDLTREQDRELLFRLAKRADVFLEDLSPNEEESLGLSYERLSPSNSRVVYCSISPFGERGPYCKKPATDLEVQGVSGITVYLGEAGKAPVKVGAPVAAIGAGLFAFQGIVAALFYRQRSGLGQKVETSMLGAMAVLQTCYWDEWSASYHRLASDPPEYGYQTQDERIFFYFIDAHEPWFRFCKALGLEHITTDPRFADPLVRQKHQKELRPILEGALAERTAEEAMALIDQSGGISAPIKTYDVIFNHPQVIANDLVLAMEHPALGKVKTTGLPWKFSQTPGAIRRSPPTLGQHTKEVLKELRHTKERFV